MAMLPIICLLILVGNTLGLKQYVEFYVQTSNCDNNPERTLTVANFTNLRPNPAQPNNEFYRSFNVFGMWQIGRCFGPVGQSPCTTGTATIEWTYHVVNEDLCVRVEGTPSPTGFDVRRLGDSAMSAPQLSLFDKPNFTPDSIVVTVMSQGLTSISLSVKSLFFTGNHRWTLYDGIEYSGQRRCLHPAQDVVRRGYGFTVQPIIDQSIRSVRFGCNGSKMMVSSSSLFAVMIMMTVIHSILHSSSS